MPNWNEAPHGVIKAAQQRFWSGLGENAESVARRMTNDSSFLEGLLLHAKGGDKVDTTAPKPPSPVFFLAAPPFALGAVASKKTSECFVIGPRYAYRDADFDNLLAADQPATKACAITTLTASRNWTFVEAAVPVLGVSKDTPVAVLSSLLKERDHTMTLAQAEEMVEATERGEKTCMRTNWYGNFFFVENEDGSVSVGSIARDVRWDAFVYRLDDGSRWYVDVRLLVRNLDALKLGL